MGPVSPHLAPDDLHSDSLAAAAKRPAEAPYSHLPGSPQRFVFMQGTSQAVGRGCIRSSDASGHAIWQFSSSLAALPFPDAPPVSQQCFVCMQRVNQAVGSVSPHLAPDDLQSDSSAAAAAKAPADAPLTNVRRLYNEVFLPRMRQLLQADVSSTPSASQKPDAVKKVGFAVVPPTTDLNYCTFHPTISELGLTLTPSTRRILDPNTLFARWHELRRKSPKRCTCNSISYAGTLYRPGALCCGLL